MSLPLRKNVRVRSTYDHLHDQFPECARGIVTLFPGVPITVVISHLNAGELASSPILEHTPLTTGMFPSLTSSRAKLVMNDP